MKTNRTITALICLILPVLIRTLWFYQGSYTRSEPIATPNYSQIELQTFPLSTPVVSEIAADRGNSSPPVVLLDIAHDNMFSVSEIEPFTRAMTDLRAELRFNDDPDVLIRMLKDADAYVVIAPTSPFSIEESDAINKFVARGGRLLVITDPTRDMSYYGYVFGDTAEKLQSVNIANTLLEAYQIAFAEDYLYDMFKNEANFRNIILTDFAQDILMKNLEQVIFYSAHSIRTEAKALIAVPETTYSSLTDTGGSWVVAARAMDGQVVALGDMTFMTRPYVQVADNQLLVQNLARWLSGEKRQRNLRDFPYLFTHPVVLLLPKDLTLDQDMLGMVNTNQRFLNTLNLSLQLSDKPIEGYDLLITSTYQQSQTKELQSFLDAFDLEFSIAGEETQDLNSETMTLTVTPSPTSETLNLAPTPTATSETQYDSASIEVTKEANTHRNKTGTDETVTIPGVGRFSLDGIGLILFSPSNEQNTLILLASSEESLSELSSLLIEEGLSDCLIQEYIAVCPVTKESKG